MPCNVVADADSNSAAGERGRCLAVLSSQTVVRVRVLEAEVRTSLPRPSDAQSRSAVGMVADAAAAAAREAPRSQLVAGCIAERLVSAEETAPAATVDAEVRAVAVHMLVSVENGMSTAGGQPLQRGMCLHDVADTGKGDTERLRRSDGVVELEGMDEMVEWANMLGMRAAG